jgi:excisionase family DNA binding protein
MNYLDTLLDAENSTPYSTVPHAAKQLGLPVSTLRRAVSRGLVPSYQPFGQRVRVCLPEVIAAIASSRSGGQNNG